MAVARAHPLCSLVAFFLWIFPRCRVSKKAASSESRTRKIHRNPRHWRSCSILTPPIEEPCTRENRARVRSLSLPRFSRLSRTHLSFSFSHSRPLLLSICRRDASTTPFSSPSSSSHPRSAPPRMALFLSRSYLPFSDDDVVVTTMLRALASSSLSLLSPCPPCSFVSPAGFLPLLRCRFRRSRRCTPNTSGRIIRDGLSSSPSLLRLRLATCYPVLQRPGRNPASEVRLQSRGSRGGREGFSGASSDIRFYKERAGILDGSRGGWTTAEMEER